MKQLSSSLFLKILPTFIFPFFNLLFISQNCFANDLLKNSQDTAITDYLWGMLGFMLAIAGGIALLSIAFFAINRHLKKRIALKTQELQTKNEQLHDEIFYRQQAETELQKNSDELEHVVDLRTRELQLEVKEHQYDLQLLRNQN